MTRDPIKRAETVSPPSSVATAEELRELALAQHQQIASLSREVADSHHLIEALRALLDEADDAEPFANVFATIAPMFHYEHALVLVEDDEASATVSCPVASDPELVDTVWGRTSMIDKALGGRVIATVVGAESDDAIPTDPRTAGIRADQPALYLPLRFRDRRGLLMMRRAPTDEGFDRGDVAVARKFSLLASQALATREANRAEQERRALEALTTDLRSARDRLAYRANHDELTGLANRRYLEQLATEAIIAAQPGDQIGIAFIDLDGFKQVNDYYGHDVGDELLIAAARRIAAYAFDSTDVAARISGDEFMILINPVHSVERVVELVRQGLADMRAPFALGERRLMVSASVGLAFFPQHGDTFEELRRNADIAMYQAKHTSRGSVTVYEPTMAEAVGDRLDAEQRLREAVADARFRAVLQPKVRLPHLQVSGFEILARQVDESGRIGDSAAFIELAGQTGLLDEITTIVLADALSQIDDLSAVYGADITFSLNVSTRQASEPAQLAALIDRLRAAEVTDRFIIELTEDALLELDTFGHDIAPLLDAAGLRVSIDDFGTGFASLSRLLVINADEIKIDRTFISDIHRQPRGQVFLEAMGTIGGEIGATVVAEGVETIDELTYLIGGDIADEVQGYLIGRPSPAADWIFGRATLDERLAGLRALSVRGPSAAAGDFRP